jgi:hypothetical protein
MSTFRRWKEERIRHYVYLEQLKATQNLSGGVSLNGARSEGRNESSDRFLHLGPDSVRDRRTSTAKENDVFAWMLRLAILAVGVATWFWLYLCQLGVHR